MLQLMNFAFGEVEGKGRGIQSTKKDAGPLKGEGHSWRAGLPPWPSIILLKRQICSQQKEKKRGGKKSLKTSQLIITPMASVGFRTSQVREDKFQPPFPELSSGELTASVLCFHVPHAKFPSFLFRFFFFYEAS